MNTLEMVREFHEKFGCESCSDFSNRALLYLRLRLLKEELGELEEALVWDNKIDVLDALTDLQYVLDGAYIALGMDKYKDKAFQLVHDSNMKKLGPDGKPVRREDGKIIKPEGWQKPNLESLFV